MFRVSAGFVDDAVSSILNQSLALFDIFKVDMTINSKNSLILYINNKYNMIPHALF